MKRDIDIDNQLQRDSQFHSHRDNDYDKQSMTFISTENMRIWTPEGKCMHARTTSCYVPLCTTSWYCLTLDWIYVEHKGTYHIYAARSNEMNLSPILLVVRD